MGWGQGRGWERSEESLGQQLRLPAFGGRIIWKEDRYKRVPLWGKLPTILQLCEVGTTIKTAAVDQMLTLRRASLLPRPLLAPELRDADFSSDSLQPDKEMPRGGGEALALRGAWDGGGKKSSEI